MVAQDNIPGNQIRSRNSIEQREHEDKAAARRVILVDEDGNPVNSDNPLPTDAVLNGDVFVDIDGFHPTNPDSAQTTGSIDGTPTGAKYGFVNNVKQQILAAHDRVQALVYADFGTKNQRVIQMNYTSPTFPGVTARKNIAYTLVGNKYRRDSITWSIV